MRDDVVLAVRERVERVLNVRIGRAGSVHRDRDRDAGGQRVVREIVEAYIDVARGAAVARSQRHDRGRNA